MTEKKLYDTDQIRVVEFRQDLEFGHEPLEAGDVVGVAEELDRDQALGRLLAGEVHVAHPAVPEGADDLVASQRPTHQS